VEFDARTAPDGTTLAADVCIIGAGPTGLTLASELQAAGLRVLLLESGSAGRQPDVQELNAGRNAGDPFDDLRLSRSRGIGGTALIWNNVLEGTAFAKYVPLDDIDFEPREGIRWSGWPVSRSALEPHFQRAQAICGLGRFDYDATSWAGPAHQLLEMGDGSLTNTVYQYGRADQFTLVLPAHLAAASTVTVVHGATAIQLVKGDHEHRITEVHWATLSGTRGTARAAAFILAAGGVENARLLLIALGEIPWLGRGFMEHPVDCSLELTTRAPALYPSPGFYSPHATGALVPVMGRIGLSRGLLNSERLRNASIRLVGTDELRILESSSLRPAARRLVPLQAARRLIANTIKGAARASRRFRPVRYQLLMDLEQGPHPENRIALSDRRDRFGLPQAEVRWHWRGEDSASLDRLRIVVARELERAGAGRVRVAAGSALHPNAHHHAGTTRMHPDATQGVVDADLKVHQMENLFVTGSSVFPTAGVANPTLTAIALTLRLADHLIGEFPGSRSTAT
jgi:choline dehydrogenase-like flavoprotein